MSQDKIGTISFRYFIKGDYVMTGRGVGIVLEDEAPITNEQDLRFSEVLLQHKEGDCDNAGNHPIKIDREMCLLITKEKYNETTFAGGRKIKKHICKDCKKEFEEYKNLSGNIEDTCSDCRWRDRINDPKESHFSMGSGNSSY